jgi:predicted NBD/HSP70 family sugar kinase
MATSAIARKINRTRVLRTLLENPLMSRAEVARDLNLTKSTLSSVVEGLIADDLILERELDSAPGRVGRPGIRIELNANSGHFLGVELAVDGLKVTALDLTAKQVGLISRRLANPGSPEAAFKQLAQMVEELSRQLSPRSEPMGMGVALPGFVDTNGVLLHAPHMGWSDFPALDHLRSRFRWPVHVDNDANLWAFGEWYLNRSLRNRQVALVSVSGGVGCGVVFEGRIIRGAHGLAGEMGHIVLDAREGNEGLSPRVTWDRIAEKDTLIADYRRLTRTRASLKHLIAAQHAGEPAALEVSTAWSRWMAYGLLSVIYAYDPDVIVVAGDMADFFEVCKDLVQAHLSEVLISGYPRARLTTSTLGPGGSAIGAAAYMHRAMFDTTRIDDIAA